jgi:ElaB/YqjD/DUF883 family membrane-anchored ribosome-binding protein
MATLDLSSDLDRLVNQIDELRRDMSSYSRSAKALGLAGGHDALVMAERFGRRARKRVERAEKRLSRNVEERPLMALLLAVGIGFVIAKLVDLAR